MLTDKHGRFKDIKGKASRRGTIKMPMRLPMYSGACIRSPRRTIPPPRSNKKLFKMFACSCGVGRESKKKERLCMTSDLDPRRSEFFGQNLAWLTLLRFVRILSLIFE